MARIIYTVGHTQVVTSEEHPEGLKSNKSGYPTDFDSKDHNLDEEETFRLAEAEYRSCEATMLRDTNHNRVMQTITLERSDGQSIYHRCRGAFPVVPEPEQPEQGE